ncbi:TPA: PIN domain-containing protein [Candidatus Bathyarchaeota archaeon]|nr:PIN domain-containing protein [Candidatus Bathyarchaeota archaeon]
MTTRIVVDSSVIVKWFKKGEESEKESLRLRDDVLSGTVNPIMSEWVYLEVMRGLVKAGFPEDKITQAYNTLREMTDLGFMEAVPVSILLEKAKELEIRLDLYASDAVNLAPALIKSVNMLSEDKHLLRGFVKDFMEKFGLKIFRLKDFYKII